MHFSLNTYQILTVFNIKIRIYVYFLKIVNLVLFGIGDWGLGIGDWGLGIGPNPQSPIPNPH
jgi:hypothetical protein